MRSTFAPQDIKGILPPLVTPFDANEEIVEHLPTSK